MLKAWVPRNRATYSGLQRGRRQGRVTRRSRYRTEEGRLDPNGTAHLISPSPTHPVVKVRCVEEALAGWGRPRSSQECSGQAVPRGPDLCTRPSSASEASRATSRRHLCSRPRCRRRSRAVVRRSGRSISHSGLNGQGAQSPEPSATPPRPGPTYSSHSSRAAVMSSWYTSAVPMARPRSLWGRPLRAGQDATAHRQVRALPVPLCSPTPGAGAAGTDGKEAAGPSGEGLTRCLWDSASGFLVLGPGTAPPPAAASPAPARRGPPGRRRGPARQPRLHLLLRPRAAPRGPWCSCRGGSGRARGPRASRPRLLRTVAAAPPARCAHAAAPRGSLPLRHKPLPGPL